MAQHPDVAIIGGGIIGLTSAYVLAQAGLAVEVLDRADFGQEASWAGAGILPPGNPERAATPIDRLRAIGSVQFPTFSRNLLEETGIDNGYRRCGGIEFLHPGDEYVLPLWQAEGIACEKVDCAGLASLEPGLGEISGTAYVLPGCAQVRNPRHMRALVAACIRAGVRLRPHEPVQTWLRGGERVEGLVLKDGARVQAGKFLIAAGAWSEPLLNALGQRPNVHPVRGQIVLLKQPEPTLGRVVMLGKEYLVPRGDGRVLVGSTEEPQAGFEKVNTPAAVARLRDLATRTVRALAEAEIEKCWAGLRPGSPDGLPFLGPVPGQDNVVVATGHFRAGVQLSIGTAHVIADLMQSRPPRVPLDCFRIDRKPDSSIRLAFRS
jgi:glycine oxidase